MTPPVRLLATCEFGHLRPPGSGADTTHCPECQRRRGIARIAMGYPPAGPLPPLPATAIERRIAA
jgi:hypothetical protein